MKLFHSFFCRYILELTLYESQYGALPSVETRVKSVEVKNRKILSVKEYRFASNFGSKGPDDNLC